MTKRWQIQSVFSPSSAAVPNSVSRHCNLARFILRSGNSICHRFFETAKRNCFHRRKGRVTGTKTIQPQHRSARAGCRNVFYSNWAVQRFRIGNWQHRIITASCHQRRQLAANRTICFVGRCEWRNWYEGTSGSLYYCYADGTYATGITTLPNEETYLFALDGTLKTGWQTIDGVRYYFDLTTGQKQFGWISHSNRLYYVFPETGKQVGEAVIDGTPYVFDGIRRFADGHLYLWRWYNCRLCRRCNPVYWFCNPMKPVRQPIISRKWLHRLVGDCRWCT